jgi:hypothetical protein
MCKRCEAYGTSCNYSSGESFQSMARGHGYFCTLQHPPCSENHLILNIINSTSDLQRTGSTQIRHGAGQFSMRDLELLNKFHRRTMTTLAKAHSNRVYQNAYMKLAYSVRPLRLLIRSVD